MNDFELGFIVGLIEGEGSLIISRIKHKRKQGFAYAYKPVVTIGNSSLSLLEKARSLIGGAIYPYNDEHRNRVTYHLQIGGQKRIVKLLTQLEPYLISKKKEAKLLIKFCKSRLLRRQKCYSPHEINLWRRCHKLKNKVHRLKSKATEPK